MSGILVVSASERGHRSFVKAALASGVGMGFGLDPLSPERRAAFSWTPMPRGYPKGTPALTIRQRFDAKWIPEPNTGCWLWVGVIKHAGYGGMGSGTGPLKSCSAHRVAWELYRGPIPEGMQIDHICRVRSCVNPDHLRVVTPRQNTLENSLSPSALNAAKTHCSRGHPLSGDNLIIERPGPTQTRRSCRSCQRDAQRTKYSNRRERKVTP